ncbi:trypsin-like peptidase domain-containing protein [Streptomyces sp. NPDC054783]
MGETGEFLSSGRRGWEQLLTNATVALDVPGQGSVNTGKGTGFFITPDIVATCAHVISPGISSESVVVRAFARGREWRLEAHPERFHRDSATGLDLALLRVTGSSDDEAPVIPVWLGAAAEVGDDLWTYGHPDNEYRDGGQPATFTFEGVSRQSGEAEAIGLPRLRGTPVGAGFSGSAVVNQRTGAVCGMLFRSNLMGGAHLLSAAEILAWCPEARSAQAAVHAHTSWLRTLSDAQLRDGGVPFPGPQLRAYLAAVERVAEKHPYPGVVPGGTLPPLSAVYMEQQTGRTQSADDTTAAEEERDGGSVERLPAMELFDLDGDCLLTGSAGAGKSTLLRRGLAELARNWQGDTHGNRFVPVRVSAADLDRGALYEAIAAGVRDDLEPMGLWQGWTAEFFQEAPVAGARWLVLVDGLDEIVSVEARNRVLGRVAAAAAETAARARFVVCTRPLPASELDDKFSKRAVRLTLLPFEPRQLTAFATAWFTALKLSDPARTAEKFTAEIARVRLDAVTNTPLMATMLCQLYIAGGSLPTGGRFGVYEAFIDLLINQQYTDKASGLSQQVRDKFEKFGKLVENMAADVQGRSHELIGHVALARYNGDLRAIRTLAVEWSGGARLPRPALQEWDSLIADLLRRSGVFVQRGEDFEFQHQTMMEFLAARRIAEDDALSAATMRKLFGVAAGFRLVGRTPQANSFNGFLMAAWGSNPGLTRILRRLAGHYSGAQFLAAQVQEGAQLGPDVVDSARATLKSAASSRNPLRGGRRIPAARALLMLGDAEGADLLESLAKNTKNRAAHRVAAAAALAGAGDPRGPALLEAFVRDSALSGSHRVEAATQLLRIAHPRGAELLGGLATDPNLPDGNRVTAAVALAECGDGRGTALLGAQAADDRFGGGQRLRAATELTRFAPSRGRDVLCALTVEQRLEDVYRVGAANELTRLRDPWARDAWAGLAADATLTAGRRVEAARTLQGLGDPRGADLLADLAALDGLPAAQRIRAAAFLMESADPRGAEALNTLAASPGIDGAHRIEAAAALARFGDPRGGDALRALAIASTLAAGHRIAAARVLAELGDPRGADLLESLARSRQLENSHRVDAAQALTDMGDARGPDALAALASDPAFDVGSRIRAAQLLDEAGDPRGIAALHAVASAPRIADPQRIQAAEALGRLGDSRGADVLFVLASDTGGKGGDRVDAAKALDRLGNPSGKQLLTELAADDRIGRLARFKAREAVSNPLRFRRK